MTGLHELSAGITQFLDAYGLIAIFVVMLLKEIGVPVPIPSDLIMLGAAAQSAAGRFDVWQAFGAILIAMVVGAWIQYTLARGLGRPFLYRLGPYVGLTPERLDRAADAVRKGGAVAVGVSLVTPGVRIATVPASGLADLPYRTFFPGLIVGSGAFLALHFVIGYVGGPIVSAVMAAVNLPMLVFIAAFFVIGLGGWMLMRQRKRGETYTTVERLGDWADASCPACLALGAVHYLRLTEGAVETAGGEHGTLQIH
jgi:membrane protein DedA with SNARE-associated domain